MRNLSDMLSDMENLGHDFQTAQAYGERGYSLPDGKVAIVFANWNNVPQPLADEIESIAECEWSDEWIVAYETGMAYRTSPDSYGWKPYFYITESGDVIGGDEIESDESLAADYIATLVNNPRAVNLFDRLDLAAHGFAQVNRETYQTGFHSGMDDNPRVILAAAQATQPGEYVFSGIGNSQFYCEYDLWFRPYASEEEEE
jgi:hypothetical protein